VRVLAKGEDAVKQDLGRLYCVVGLLFGVGGILFALLGASAKVSAGVVGRRWASWATSLARDG
jgi:hypothetical protein